MNPNEPTPDPNQLPTPEPTPSPNPMPVSPQATPPVAPVPAPVFSSAPLDAPAPKKLPIKLIIIIVAIVVGLAILGTIGFIIFRTVSGGANPLSPASLFSADVTTETYTNQELKFSVDVPKGWESEVAINEGIGGRVAFTEPVGDIKDKSEANLHYASLAIGLDDSSDAKYAQMSETEYLSNVKKGVQQTIASSESGDGDTVFTLESGEDATVNGLKAYQIKTKATDKKDTTIEYNYSVFIFVDESHQYTVSLTADQSETAILKKANQILASFKHL